MDTESVSHFLDELVAWAGDPPSRQPAPVSKSSSAGSVNRNGKEYMVARLRKRLANEAGRTENGARNYDPVEETRCLVMHEEDNAPDIPDRGPAPY